MSDHTQTIDYAQLAQDIKGWAKELGFADARITDTELAEDEKRLKRYIAEKRYGQMQWITHHGNMRSRPQQLLPGTIRIISVRMNYTDTDIQKAWDTLDDDTLAYISRYALGRDYHKMIRKRLTKLAKRIEKESGDFGYRAFCDSAPVMEKALARKSGIGWTGKNTLTLSREGGSLFFLGELFTDLPLPVDKPVNNYCGTCTRCITACPTGAIIAPYTLDAKRCISYLTIELKGSIPEDLRKPMGNRIFGCDDCQLACPWNKFAQVTMENDFAPRHNLDAAKLIDLFAWDEATYLKKTEGMAIRRAGFESWLRNIAIALGNASPSKAVKQALLSRANHPSAIVREHVTWALDEQAKKSNKATPAPSSQAEM